MAKKIAFTVDSSCDVPQGFIEQNNIIVFPITNILGENVYRDGVDITASELLQKVKETGIMPKTSALPVVEYEEKFEELLKTHDEVIHLSISSKASSSFQNSEIACKKFNGKVYAIDTKLLSGGIGLVLNQMLWFIHDTYISAYPSMVVEIIISIITIYNILKYCSQNKMKFQKK